MEFHRQRGGIVPRSSTACPLIARKTAPFDPERFHDHYTEALRELIDAKAKHRKPISIDESEPSGGARIIDLVDALKRSVAQRKAG